MNSVHLCCFLYYHGDGLSKTYRGFSGKTLREAPRGALLPWIKDRTRSRKEVDFLLREAKPPLKVKFIPPRFIKLTQRVFLSEPSL